MCNRIKKSANSKTVRCAKQIGCAKNSIWDLINISINRRDERDVQRVCTGYAHIAAIWMMRI